MSEGLSPRQDKLAKSIGEQRQSSGEVVAAVLQNELAARVTDTKLSRTERFAAGVARRMHRHNERDATRHFHDNEDAYRAQALQEAAAKGEQIDLMQPGEQPPAQPRSPHEVPKADAAPEQVKTPLSAEASADAMLTEISAGWDHAATELGVNQAELIDEANRAKSAAVAREAISGTNPSETPADNWYDDKNDGLRTPVDPEALATTAAAIGVDQSLLSPDGTQIREVDPDRAMTMAINTNDAEQKLANMRTVHKVDAHTVSGDDLAAQKKIVKRRTEAFGLVHDMVKDPTNEQIVREHPSASPDMSASERMALAAMPSVRESIRAEAAGYQDRADANQLVTRRNMSRAELSTDRGDASIHLEKPVRERGGFFRRLFGRNHQN